MNERPGIKNLRPVKSVEEAREKGRKGGIKSGKVRREKKLLSQIYAEVIAEMYDVEKGADLKTIVKSVLKNRDNSTVAMLRTMGDLTEGKSVNLTGSVGTYKMSKEERAARIAELEAIRKND